MSFSLFTVEPLLKDTPNKETIDLTLGHILRSLQDHSNIILSLNEDNILSSLYTCIVPKKGGPKMSEIPLYFLE